MDSLREFGRFYCKIGFLLVALGAFTSFTFSQAFRGIIFPTEESLCFSRIGNNVPNCAQKKSGRLMNAAILSYDDEIREKFEDLLSRKVPARHRELISLVRDFLDPPSDHMIKLSRRVVETPQSVAILDILKNKEHGFFVEAGGLDGERSSNTLYMEQKLGWTGLLVEMDPYFYTQLRGKNRKCWSINACIGPSDRPIKMNFKESSAGTGRLTSSDDDQSVPCFPLESMLLALNRSRVDYFSLDVEGYELDVLETIPYDRVDITTLSVEYVHGKGDKNAYRSFMEGKGYYVHEDIQYKDAKAQLYVDDYIFVTKSLLE